jgi:hypothetical protein
MSRVTRLGEVWPIGRLLMYINTYVCNLGCLLKITELDLIFGLLYLFSNYVLILTKYGLGFVLGDFFTNSSGHPAHVTLKR